MSTVYFGASSHAMNILSNDEKPDAPRGARFEQRRFACDRDSTVCAVEQFASVPDETSGAKTSGGRQRRALDKDHVVAKENKERSEVSSVPLVDIHPVQRIVNVVVNFFSKIDIDDGTKSMNVNQYQQYLTALAMAGAKKYRDESFADTIA